MLAVPTRKPSFHCRNDVGVAGMRSAIKGYFHVRAHRHEHVVLVSASGKTRVDEISNGVAGLTDTKGHGSTLAFVAFEVLTITGTISHESSCHRDTGHVKVLLQVLGSHRG